MFIGVGTGIETIAACFLLVGSAFGEITSRPGNTIMTLANRLLDAANEQMKALECWSSPLALQVLTVIVPRKAPEPTFFYLVSGIMATHSCWGVGLLGGG